MYCLHVLQRIAVPAGGAIAPQVSKIWKNSNFSGSDMKNLCKVRSFRALTLINYKNWLPNLGEDLFFLENTLILGRKLKNM